MFNLSKQSRLYDGHPYCGPTSNYQFAQYATIEEARKARDEFQLKNPVGWNIYDADDGTLIEGMDVFI
jgi:hypothetical protein